MEILPLPGVTGRQILNSLVQVKDNLGSAIAPRSDHTTPQERYTTWASASSDLLGHILHQQSLVHLILTPRHWAILGMANGINSLSVTNTEMSDRIREFNRVIDDLRVEVQKWDNLPGKFVVLDTNVYLHYSQMFDLVNWHEKLEIPLGETLNLIVPLLVVRELDRKKMSSSNNKVSNTDSTLVRTRARQTLSRLNIFFGEPTTTYTFEPPSDGVSRQTLTLLFDDLSHVALSSPDQEIIERSFFLQGRSGRKVKLVTLDHAMAFAARNDGLESKLLDTPD